MAKAMEIFRKLAIVRARPKGEAPSMFDLRLQKMGGVRHVTVARAVLFRTSRPHSAT